MPRTVLALVAVLALLAARAVAGPPESTGVEGREAGAATAITRMLERPRRGAPGRTDLADVRDSLRAFYSRRAGGPCWVVAGRPTPLAHGWIDALSSLEDYGVVSGALDSASLGDSAAALDRGPRPVESIAAFDVGLSAWVTRALRALHGGRIDPALVDSNLIVLHRRLPASLMLDSISTGGEPRVWMDRVQPSFHAYWLLLQALGRYREAAADPSLLPLPSRPARLRLGGSCSNAGRLRRLLALTGDLPSARPRQPTPDTLVDRRLIDGVTRFQRRNSLPATGRADSTTWERLGRALDDRIAQIGRTLELWRWLPQDLPMPILLINIPAFRLQAVERLDQPDSTMLRIDVVVGKAFRSQTPVLTAALTSVEFAPEWDVPPTIARNEVQPAAMADSVYLRRNHMVLLRGGATLPPTPAAIEQIGKGVRVQQQPGPDNPLGGVKFVMPNRYDIYLHDTPARDLFRRRQRDFSHGCIRLGKAAALARYVLRDRPEWTPARIDSAMLGTKTLKVRLARPLLVAIVYATVEAREDGTLAFHRDVYGHDRALEMLLAGAPPDSLAALRARLEPPPPAPPPMPDSTRRDSLFRPDTAAAPPH